MVKGCGHGPVTPPSAPTGGGEGGVRTRQVRQRRCTKYLWALYSHPIRLDGTQLVDYNDNGNKNRLIFFYEAIFLGDAAGAMVWEQQGLVQTYYRSRRWTVLTGPCLAYYGLIPLGDDPKLPRGLDQS